MRILVDMNLTPGWCTVLQAAGHDAVHWSTLGRRDAPDKELFDWARTECALVFTHDLDFGHLLALSGDTGPSVVQLRVQAPTPDLWAATVVQVLADHATILAQGALATIDPNRHRVRILPIGVHPTTGQ